MDFDSAGDRRKEIEISKSDKVENTKESVEEDVPKILSAEIRTAVEIMDSESTGDREEEMQICKRDNVENAKESMEESIEYAEKSAFIRIFMKTTQFKDVPKVLNPELHDAVTVSANTLVVKPFMKRTMTSKGIQKRCTKNKARRINVKESSFDLHDGGKPVSSRIIDGSIEETQIFKNNNVENVKEPTEEDVPKILNPEIRAAVGIMESDSNVDRQEDIQICKNNNVENTNESMEESVDDDMEENVPKILSPELHNVFHVFASMLDVKSFTRLAMASKEMYNRCVEDESIRINVDELDLNVHHDENSPVFVVRSVNGHPSHMDGYLAALRKLPCRVMLRRLSFGRCEEQDSSTVHATLRLAKDIGVERIEKLIFNSGFVEWRAVTSFILSFRVDEVDLETTPPIPITRSLLNLRIKKLTEAYNQDISSIDLLLEEIDHPVPEVSFPVIGHIDKIRFMKLLSKIHTGVLRRLFIRSQAVNWKEFDMLPFDYEGPLPENRSLLFEKKTTNGNDEYWFLGSDRGVTKCVEHSWNYTQEIFKCEPWEYPWILREDEDVLKDLTEKRPRVSCSASQFQKFAATFEHFSARTSGALPDDRPLFFPLRDCFWLLEEDDVVTKWEWEDGCAAWRDDTPHYYLKRHPSIEKHFFWKVLKENIKLCKNSIYCQGVKEFDRWFEDYEKLDFDYSGPLPSTRPLIFERTSAKERRLRIVLLEDRLLQCALSRRNGVKIDYCVAVNTPSILMTSENVKEILKMWLESKQISIKENKFLITCDMFWDGFELFKKSCFDPDDLRKRPMVYETTTFTADSEIIDERWFCDDRINIRKATWKDGLFLISPMEFSDVPVDFMNQLFRRFAENGFAPRTYYLAQEQIRLCLEQFNVVPFEYSGSLKSDSPIAFVKKEERQRTPVRAAKRPRWTADFYLRIWFLWDGAKTTYCSWEEERAEEVIFRTSSRLREMPPGLSSKKYLKALLKRDFGDSSRFEWFGPLSDLRSLLDSHKKLPYDYDGPLPDERPLVMETEEENASLLLREDGTVIKCKY